MSKEVERRLEDLESQLAFQDSLYQELNDVVARQDREITTLKAQIKELARRLADARDGAIQVSTDPGDEVPPHY